MSTLLAEREGPGSHASVHKKRPRGVPETLGTPAVSALTQLRVDEKGVRNARRKATDNDKKSPENSNGDDESLSKARQTERMI